MDRVQEVYEICLGLSAICLPLKPLISLVIYHEEPCDCPLDCPVASFIALTIALAIPVGLRPSGFPGVPLCFQALRYYLRQINGPCTYQSVASCSLFQRKIVLGLSSENLKEWHTTYCHVKLDIFESTQNFLEYLRLRG